MRTPTPGETLSKIARQIFFLTTPVKFFFIYCQKMERTGAGVEWLTSVPEVPGSILSRGAFRCGLEQVTFPQLLG